MQRKSVEKVWIGLISVLVASALLAACGVEHISILRDAQSDFSTVSRIENIGTVNVLFPDRDYLKQEAEAYLATYVEEGTGKASPVFEAERAQYLFSQYHNIYLRLKALENSARSRLQSDGLYGTCAALRIFAHWRATFYAHVLRLDIGIQTKPEELEALTEVTAEAEGLLRRFSNQIQPRDRFFLMAMPALVRYDIAVLQFVKAKKEGRLIETEEGQKVAKQIVEQMMAAEEEFRSINAFEFRHLEMYKILARYSMLYMAYTVGRSAFRWNNPETRQQLPRLAASIDTFHQEVNVKDVFKDLEIDLSTLDRDLPLMAR